MGIALILLVIAFVVWIGGQASATANLKRESHEHFVKSEEAYVERIKKESEEQDLWWDVRLRRSDFYFYSDGSLRFDKVTKKSYPKGMYYCDSTGRGPMAREMPAGTPRPPKT